MKPEKGKDKLMDDIVCEMEPVEILVQMGMLILESRVPHPGSTKGRIEGPHCPRDVASWNGHNCDTENILCKQFTRVQRQMRPLWHNNIPVCIEIVILPSCIHGKELSGCLDSLPPNHYNSIQSILLERWVIHNVSRRSAENMTALRSLFQAMKSHLYFSQLSSWLHSTQGLRPSCIGYRISPPAEFCTSSFSSAPINHTFPTAGISRSSCIRVSISQLARLTCIPEPLCHICSKPNNDTKIPKQLETLSGTSSNSSSLSGDSQCSNSLVDDNIFANIYHNAPCSDEQIMLGDMDLNIVNDLQSLRIHKPVIPAIRGDITILNQQKQNNCDKECEQTINLTVCDIPDIFKNNIVRPKQRDNIDDSLSLHSSKPIVRNIAMASVLKRTSLQFDNAIMIDKDERTRLASPQDCPADFFISSDFKRVSKKLEFCKNVKPSSQICNSLFVNALDTRHSYPNMRPLDYSDNSNNININFRPANDVFISNFGADSNFQTIDTLDNKSKTFFSHIIDDVCSSSDGSSPDFDAYLGNTLEKQMLEPLGVNEVEASMKKLIQVKHRIKANACNKKPIFDIDPTKVANFGTQWKIGNISQSENNTNWEKNHFTKCDDMNAELQLFKNERSIDNKFINENNYFDKNTKQYSLNGNKNIEINFSHKEKDEYVFSDEKNDYHRNGVTDLDKTDDYLISSKSNDQNLSQNKNEKIITNNDSIILNNYTDNYNGKTINMLNSSNSTCDDYKTINYAAENEIFDGKEINNELSLHRSISCPNKKLLAKKVFSSKNLEKCKSTDCPEGQKEGKLRTHPKKNVKSIFNLTTRLPLQSSPVPMKRMSSSSFDYDGSLTSVQKIKNSLSCTSLHKEAIENRHSQIFSKSQHSTSAPASTNCLLGSFEESLINGRIDPAGIIEGFTADIGASGSFCPNHICLPVTAFYFQLSEDNAPSPYLGHLNLEGYSQRGYHIPNCGTIQVTLFNPNKSVVKMFVVKYDLSDMPSSHQTMLRQRTLYMPIRGSPSDVPNASVFLRYLIHLRLASSKTNKIYLHTDIRMIFSRDKFEYDSRIAHYELRSFTEAPENPKYSPKR